MFNISSIYPRKEGYEFDFDYYLNKHMPRSIELLSAAKGFKGVSVEKGIEIEHPEIGSSYVAMCHYYFDTLDDFMAAFGPHAEELQSDIANYTNIEPMIQVNEIRISKQSTRPENFDRREAPLGSLEELELALLNPAGRKDPALLGRLLADDFVEVGAGGRTFGKGDLIAALAGEADIAVRAEAMRVELVSPTAALVTYTAVKTHKGQSTRSRRCSLWRYDRDRWQIVYHQGTAVAAAD